MHTFSAKWSPSARDGTGIEPQAQVPADTRLYQRTILAQRGKRAGAAAEHRHEQTRLSLLQPLEMPQQLVDPDGHLVAEGRGYGMLAVRASCHRHLGATLGEIGHRREGLAD